MDVTLATAIKKALGTYPLVRDKYYGDVFVAVYDYLDSGERSTSFKSSMKRAMVEAFTPTAEIAWQDAGADLPLDDSVNEWLTTMQQAELGYIDVLFQSLKDLRTVEGIDKTATATARADGYTRTLDRIYNYVKVAAGKSVMLTFVGDDGAASCSDCQRYKGKRHKASWWVANDAVPPNRNFECGGWQCFHVLVDDKGEVWTL